MKRILKRKVEANKWGHCMRIRINFSCVWFFYHLLFIIVIVFVVDKQLKTFSVV